MIQVGESCGNAYLLSTYMLYIIYGQGCCTAGDVARVWAVGRGLLCMWIHVLLAACALCPADVLGMAACNDRRGYFAVK